MEEVSFILTGYRFGFNGQEKDDEITGSSGSHLNYKFRMYDSRIARFFAVDPIAAQYPMLTPYQHSSLNPIWNIELEGLEGKPFFFVNRRLRLNIAKSAFTHPLPNDLIQYFGTGKGETYKMTQEEMKAAHVMPVSVMDFEDIKEAYESLKVGESKVVTSSMSDAIAKTFGTLGQFTIQI